MPGIQIIGLSIFEDKITPFKMNTVGNKTSQPVIPAQAGIQRI
jgi:hypothetical protein